MQPLIYLLWMTLSFAIYMSWITIRFGILSSISESFYALRDEYGKSSLIPWLFWLFLINVSWPIFPLLHFSGFSFFAMAGIIFVGAAAQYRMGSPTELVHVIGAASGIILSFIAIGFVFGGWAWAWLPATALIIGILNWVRIKNYTWWLEVVSFVLIIIALAVHAL